MRKQQPTKPNDLLNGAIISADNAYNRGDLDTFDGIMAAIAKHFYPLSIIPHV